MKNNWKDYTTHISDGLKFVTADLVCEKFSRLLTIIDLEAARTFYGPLSYSEAPPLCCDPDTLCYSQRML